MTEIAVRQGTGLAMTGDQDFWNDKQLAALRQIGVDRASNGDLAVFMHVCQRTGLDPFARQIYMILRDGKQVIQTGIDGMRLVARRAVDRNREAFSIGAPEWCGEDGIWRDVWLTNEKPAAARVTVTRGDGTFTAVALWREYVQTKRDGAITRMWETRSAGQLAKCAEALALRKACPQDLSGVYAEEELQRDDMPREPRSGGLGAALAASQPDSTPEVHPQDDEPVDAEIVDEPTYAPSDPIQRNQLTKLQILLREVGMGGPENRDDALAYYARVTGREVDSSKALTRNEAGQVLSDLERVKNGEPNLLDPASANDPALDLGDGAA